MRLLLDTHVFLWVESDAARLSPAAAAAVTDPANAVYFSVVNVLELVIKSRLNKLVLTRPVEDIVRGQSANGLVLLDVTLAHVLEVGALPPVHRDPFDRLLVAQARAEGLTLVSADPLVRQYPVPTLW